MNAPEDNKRFWRLLSDYEELTRGETAAVQHRDYPSLEAAQERKSDILRVLQRTAAHLGLDRTNCPELVRRLDAVSAAEAANLEALAARRVRMQQQSDELRASWQRFRSVRKNYGSEPSPGVPMGGFAACG